jgi:hypothetical protein
MELRPFNQAWREIEETLKRSEPFFRDWWNAEHLKGKVSTEVLTPQEFLEQKQEMRTPSADSTGIL